MGVLINIIDTCSASRNYHQYKSPQIEINFYSVERKLLYEYRVETWSVKYMMNIFFAASVNLTRKPDHRATVNVRSFAKTLYYTCFINNQLNNMFPVILLDFSKVNYDLTSLYVSKQ